MDVYQSYGQVAAAGNSISDATLLPYHVNLVNAADNVKGVKLPLLNPTINEVFLFNNSQFNAVFVYAHIAPSSTDTILGYTSPYVLSGYQFTTFKRVSISQWVISDPVYRTAPQYLINVTGNNQSNAAPLSLGATFWEPVGSDGVKGVKLPAASASTVGITRYLYNNGPGILLLWPNTDNNINSGALNASYSIPSGRFCTIMCTGVANWVIAVGA